MRSHAYPRRLGIVAMVMICLLTALTACQGQSGSSTPDQPDSQITPNLELIAELPDAIRTSGVLTVASDPSYPPMEFIEDGKWVGADMDLALAIGRLLDLRVEFHTTPFSNIVPAVAVDRYDLGISSLWADNTTATLTDMVTYMQAGVQMAAKTKDNLQIRTLADLCGLTVALEEGTEFIDKLVLASTACVKAGGKPIKLIARDNQQAATALLETGKADVMLADSPVVTFAVDRSNGTIESVSAPLDIRPYGIAVSAAEVGFSDVIRDAVQELMSSGAYEAILTRWNLMSNAIETPEVLPARHPELLEMPQQQPPGNVSAR